MGDLSECTSNAHGQLNLDKLQFIDDGEDDGGEDGTSAYGMTKKSSNNTNSNIPLNGDQDYSSDVRIKIEDNEYDLSRCVPPCNDGGCTVEGATIGINGHDPDEKEPIISQSMRRGKEANGFDEVAQIEGSEEDVQTSSGSPSQDFSDSDGGSWREENITDDETGGIPRNRTEHSKYQPSDRNAKYELLNNEDSDSQEYCPPNGGPNIHRNLYSGPIDHNELFIGIGENSHDHTTRFGNNNLSTVDTYITSHSPSTNQCVPIDDPVKFNLSMPRYPNRSPQMGYGLSGGLKGSLSPNTRNTSHSNYSSFSNNRHTLPYETKAPPFIDENGDLNEAKVRASTMTLLSSQRDKMANGSPKGMPKAEPISVDDAESTATATSSNDAETAKKKKKKKKRTSTIKGDLPDASDKKSGISSMPRNSQISQMEIGESTTHLETNAATYPPTIESCGPTVMDNTQRQKVKNKSKNKKRSENTMLAREIEGNRGSDDIDSLLNYVEGNKGNKNKTTDKGKATTNVPSSQEKKNKKQKVISRSFTTDSSTLVGHENGQPFVMGRVIEHAIESEQAECAKLVSVTLPNDSVESFTSISTNAGSNVSDPSCSDTPEPTQSTTEPETQQNNVQDTQMSSKILTETHEGSAMAQTTSNNVSQSAKESPNLSTSKTTNSCNDKSVKLDVSNKSESTPTELEFTNFEGLVETAEEMPFERYVGRKKKRNQPIPRSQQGPPVNSPYTQQRGPRWANPQQHPHYSNRVNGNGYNNSASPYNHGNSKMYVNQTNYRYPSNLSHGAKPPAGPQARASPHLQSAGGDPRKSPICASVSKSISVQPATASPLTMMASVAVSTTTSASVVSSSSIKSLPLKEEFPPLPTSASESALPGKRVVNAALPNTVSISVTTTTSVNRVGQASHTNNPESVTTICSSVSHARSATTVPSPAGDSGSYSTKVSSMAASAISSATPRGDDKGDALEFTWNYFEVQHFIQKLYPSTNECNFYSEASKQAHYAKTSSAGHQRNH